MNGRFLAVTALIAGAANAQSSAAPLATQRPKPAGSATAGIRRTSTLAALGFPNGLSLEAPAERTLSFRLPGNARLDSARLHVRVRFSPAAVPQSNVQIFVNDVRRAVVLRLAADSTGTAVADVRLPGNSVGADYATVRIRAAVAALPDRCLDDRVSLSFAEIDPSSSFTYYAAADAITDVRQIWGGLPDTVAMALPARPLTPDEFTTALTLSVAARNEGHAVSYVALPTPADLAIAPASDLSSVAGLTITAPAGANVGVTRFERNGSTTHGLFIDPRDATAAAFLGPRWTPLTSLGAATVRTATSDDSLSATMTFRDLGLADLARDLGAEATWRVPLDLKDMPPGRVPSRVRLQLATAPNTSNRQIVVFVFLNGSLVRSADVVTTGLPQTIDVRLPSALLAMRNELRVSLQRHVASGDVCGPRDVPFPAQLLPTSEVETAAADGGARIFSAVTASLTPASALYLPRSALSQPASFLPVVTALGRAFWNARRAPHPVFYDQTAPPAPAGAFVVVGRPSSVQLSGPVALDSGRLRIRRKEGGETLVDVSDLHAWSVAQVVRWNGRTGVQLLPAAERTLVPDWPDAYGNNSLTLANGDSTLFTLNTAGREGSLLFNEGPSILERVRADWILWGIFALLLIAPIIYLSLRAIVRRTPRRRLPSRAPRTGQGPSQPGAR